MTTEMSLVGTPLAPAYIGMISSRIDDELYSKYPVTQVNDHPVTRFEGDALGRVLDLQTDTLNGGN